MIKHQQTALRSVARTEVPARKTERLGPFLKWAGGKEQELKHILPLVPPFDSFYEPFVGGGAVFFSLQPPRSFINDKSPELFNLYHMIAQQNEHFFAALDTLFRSWQHISILVDREATNIIDMYNQYSMDTFLEEEMENRLLAFIQSHVDDFSEMAQAVFSTGVQHFLDEMKRNLLSKTKRMKAIENKKRKLPDYDIVANIECALKSAFYMHIRHLYNNIEKYEIQPALAAALFFFVRENAYASMFRYNSQGKFNVPYGGISYNRKDLARKIAYMQSPALHRLLKNTVIENLDFEEFLHRHAPERDDFIFLDPPYDSEFSTYAQNEFSIKDQERLAHYLMNRCRARFMLVIKNTPTIFRLYNQANLTIRTVDKRYLVSFQDRNDKHAEHLIITNY